QVRGKVEIDEIEHVDDDIVTTGELTDEPSSDGVGEAPFPGAADDHRQAEGGGIVHARHPGCSSPLEVKGSDFTQPLVQRSSVFGNAPAILAELYALVPLPRADVLQPGDGPRPGDCYLPATPDTVSWGRLPHRASTPQASVAPG